MTTPVSYNWPPQTHDDVKKKIDEIDTRAQPAFNAFRFYINGAWEVRGTANPLIPRTWVKHDKTLPNPPEGGTGFKTGVGGDILLAES